ncbi:pro-resilin-like [Procambarus clarkii]|uniref:pro-resilin-like n=1 Tax=Procambarus clarkii TaxID=6728 RepID=UPI003743E176
MVSKVTLMVAAMVGVVVGAPQYGYVPPQSPSTLYETPQKPPTSLYETPQKPPSSLYETPEPERLYQAPSDNILIAQSQNIVPRVVDPPKQEGMPYDFQWDVQDPDSGNAFSHVENSDGRTTQGEYRVLMPDGRTQVVKFFDNGDGFNAEVTYEKK